MEKTDKDQPNTNKMQSNIRTSSLSNVDKGREKTAVGTCLGNCVKCGSPCCLDAGHPGPHFCYLCK